jgi:hypothetical protein
MLQNNFLFSFHLGYNDYRAAQHPAYAGGYGYQPYYNGTISYRVQGSSNHPGMNASPASYRTMGPRYQLINDQSGK